MNVVLLSHTLEPESIVTVAAKLCYSKLGIEELKGLQSPEDIQEFLKKLVDMGHESPLEHASFTFGIEGISRACSHQLVRHRIASYSQQSQRYVNLKECFDYVTPKEIQRDVVANNLFDNVMDFVHRNYILLTNRLKEDYLSEGMSLRDAEKKAIENARAILPNACETKIVMTMNARELLHFFEKRCCARAQEEIRDMAYEMLKCCKEVSPNIFAKAGPPCTKGYCPEGPMTCGKLTKREKEISNENN